ncbi:MAG: extracellular solute-binding protein [Clostridiales bacterium]|jgi:arabinogalactan oligomer/maltooligosaccharide transport system substrate-binding protein|nr:extracellular solute-binding protein [Clostridiales bacterium]
MKRFILFILAITAMLSLPACGGDESGGEGKGLGLVIWHDKEDAVAAALQAELDTLKPDINVRLEKKNGLTEALKMVGNDPKAAPDFYFFAHDKLGVYAEMGILSPITELVDKAALGGFLPMTIEAATYKGAVYQLPIYFETLLFMYNRALMPDDEVPATTEELYSFMASGAGGKYGFIEQHSTAYYSAGWIHGFGGGIVTEDGVPLLDTPETVKALEYHGKFVERMPGESEYATVNTLFREGRAASTIGGPWLVPTARESGIDLGLAPMPVVDETGLPIAPYSGVQGLHVLKVAADNPEKNAAIREVLKLLLNPGIGAAMAKASGCAPALEACYDADDIKNDSLVMMMRQTAEKAVPMPNIPEMDVMWNVVSNLLVDINMRGRDAAEAAADAQKNAWDLIKAMK